MASTMPARGNLIPFDAMAQAAQDITIWTDAGAAALVRQILERMSGECRVIGVGGPRVAEVDDLARALDVPREDDLRKLLVERRAAWLLLASMTDVGRDDLAMALNFGATVLALEPPGAHFDDWQAIRAPVRGSDKSSAGRLALCPSFQRCPGWIAAAQPQQVLGELQLIGYTSLGRRDQGSLFARLFDGWDLLLQLAPLPELINAALTGPLPDVPNDLRGITGHLAIQARWGNRLTAALQFSDRGGAAGRQLHLVGAEAHLSVGDMTYRLHETSGKLLDELRQQQEPGDYADMVAADWRTLLQQAAPTTPSDQLRQHEARVIACCLACLLSARTMQPESPQKLLKLQALSAGMTIDAR